MSPPSNPNENLHHQYGPNENTSHEYGPNENNTPENGLSGVSRQDEELEIIQRQLRFPEIKASFFTLFRYATVGDYVIIAISTVCALAAGAILPIPPVDTTFPFKLAIVLLIFYTDYIW